MTAENCGEHCLEIEDDYTMAELCKSNLTSSIQGKLRKKSPISSKCSIFRVPPRLHKEKERIEPLLVSIGPFHHGKKKLQTMEKIKLWYLHCLLNRAPTRETTLECFIEAIKSIEQECRACYAGEIDHHAGKKFIEMMVVDGCFIVEFFRKYSEEVRQDKEDPVFNTSWMVWEITNDLFLLENQLPWRVIDCLFNLTQSNAERRSLLNLLDFFIQHVICIRIHADRQIQYKHLLDCLRNSMAETYQVTKADQLKSFEVDPIPSLTELRQAGVKFKERPMEDSLNVTFKDGVMTIPKIQVSEITKTILLNLVVFENCDRSGDHKITSYVKLLKDLLNTSEEISKILSGIGNKKQLMAEESSSNQTSVSARGVTEVVSSIQGNFVKSLQFHLNVPYLEFRIDDAGIMKQLLSQTPTGKTTLECFVEAIGRIEQECRACYEGEIGFSEKGFIEMMVVDGCFILELFRKDLNEVQQDEEDPVFYMPWMYWRLLIDITILDNQLPWCALDCLFNLTKSNTEQRSLSNLTLSYFTLERFPPDNLKQAHILDCIRNSLIGTCTVTPAGPGVLSYAYQIPSVIKLIQAGVTFKVGDETNLSNITFKNGVMTIPPRFVWEETEYLLRNLTTFEQCDRSKDFRITSYAKLFDDLINTSQDVEFLKHQQILGLYLSDEDASSFFNRLYRDASVGAFLYSDLYHEVNAYCKRHWNRWRAMLKRDYFGNPWTILSFIAALLILVFTFSQTLYSILSCYQCTP
ncbi:hypothetical protein FH972_018842 [Carpinus fangiana]|uniref:Uncharacterized protein n=1 Tax=Carpinus fangiana TaxID=176857 RepID=A0A5N6RPS5_9ROSI|nr:hypothetical protein FH972_018842 [Carpinus fangiana]